MTRCRVGRADLRDANDNPVNTRDVVVSDDGNGNAVLTFPGGESVTLQGISPGSLNSGAALHSLGIPCFVAGTRILTTSGEVSVERLRAGDLVITLDHGAQPLIWVGGRACGADDLAARPEIAPVLIRDGALGNSGDLSLSPQHAVLSPCGQYMIRARHLAEYSGKAFRVMHGRRQVSYHHILLERHQIVLANGAACESLYPGAMTRSALSKAQWSEICTLLPRLRLVAYDPELIGIAYGPRVRPLVGRSRAAQLLNLPHVAVSMRT